MAQTIKHRRGSVASVRNITSFGEAEIVIGSGSVDSKVDGPIVYVGKPGGSSAANDYVPISKMYTGGGLPSITPANYGSTLDGLPYYDSTNKKLYILGSHTDGTSGHTEIRINSASIENFDSVVVSALPAGTISGSSQLPANIVSGSTQIVSLLPAGTVSGSDQITDVITDNYISSSAAASGFGTGGGSDITVQDEGSSLSTAATTLNFVGNAVTATGTGATKTITINTAGSTLDIDSQIDGTGITVEATDKLILSDDGTEKKINVSQLFDSADFDTEVAANTAVTANTAKVTYPSADSTKVGFLTVTQAVDLDTMESNIATNNSKVGYTDAAVKTKLNTEGVISGSSQVTITEEQISDLQSYLTAVPAGTISGSAGIVAGLVGQNLNIGELTATKVVTNVVSQSISFATGSTIFGDELTDVHQITGSLNLTGSFSFSEIDGGNF